MEISFKQLDETHVNILSGGKVIGHIFSPAGSGNDVKNAIQVCGFEEAYDLWGCGIFGEKDENGKVRQKKDIQLMFREYEVAHAERFYPGCVCCFNDPCNCHQPTTKECGPFNVKREEDLPLEGKRSV